MKIFALFCFALLFVACSRDPHDTIVPMDISKWSTTVKPALQKLTPEERVLFTQYIRRHTTGGAETRSIGDKADPIPADLTIGRAIEDQRSYIASEQVKQPVQTQEPAH